MVDVLYVVVLFQSFKAFLDIRGFFLQKWLGYLWDFSKIDKSIPAYSRVIFSQRPYAEALAAGDAQEEIMRKVMQYPDIENQRDSAEVEKLMVELVA